MNDKRNQVTIVSVVAIVFTLSFLFFSLTMDRSVSVYDESIILEGASRVALGEVPHRDFYANYGPAQFYVLGALFKMFGFSVFVERIWDTVVRSGIVAVSFVLVYLSASRREGAIAALTVAIWLAASKTYAFPMFPALLCALTAATCVIPLFRGERSLLLSVTSGAAIGLTVLFRYDVGLYSFAALSCVILAFTYTREEASPSRISVAFRNLLPFCFGLAIVCIPVAFAYAKGNVLVNFAFDIIYYPAHYYYRMRNLPFPTPMDIVQSPNFASVYLPPVMWIVAAIVANVSLRVENDNAATRRWVMFLLGLLSMMFYLKGSVRVSFIHMFLSIVPALLICALSLRSLARPRNTLILRAAAFTSLLGVMVVGVLTLGLLQGTLADAKSNVTWALRGDVWKQGDSANEQIGSCRPAPELQRLACFQTETDRARAISYIVTNSQPTETIFEGVPHHDRIFVNDMLIYFATALRPASKWYQFDPGLQTSRETQVDMIAEFRASRPRFVIIDSTWVGANEPNESSLSSGITLLDEYIASQYHVIREFGAITVLQPQQN